MLGRFKRYFSPDSSGGENFKSKEEKKRKLPELVPGQQEFVANREKDFRVEGMGDVSIVCDYGGEGSKYKGRNEDRAVFSDNSCNGRFMLGVIDGAGGSGNGEEASRLAGIEALKEYGSDGRGSMEPVFRRADKAVREFANGGYATGVLVSVDKKDGFISVGSVGDAKVMTIREGKKLEEGTSTMDNMAAIINGESTPDYFTAKNNNIITKAIGLKKNRGNESVCKTKDFQGKNGDVMILASDGLWDVVSEYEVQQITKKYKGDSVKIRQELFSLSHSRNNSKEPFKIQCSPSQYVDMEANFGHGDNITIQVVELFGLENDAKDTSRKKTGGSGFEARKSPESQEVGFDRKKFLEMNGDIGWIKKIASDKKEIPIKRTSGEWNSAIIDGVDDENYTAKVVFEGGHYKAVPLEVLISWMKESGNYSKASDMYSGLSGDIDNILRKEEFDAVKFASLDKNFKKGLVIELPVQLSQDGIMKRRSCTVTNVDKGNGLLTVKYALNEGVGSNKGAVRLIEQTQVSMADAYYHAQANEWRK